MAKQSPPVGQTFTARSLNGTMGQPVTIEKKEGFISAIYYYLQYIARSIRT